MRKRISEQNIFPNLNLYEEYLKIEKVLSIMILAGTYWTNGTKSAPSYTIEDYLNKEAFSNWNLRGSFFSTTEMKNRIDEDWLLDYLQYARNCIDYFKRCTGRPGTAYISNQNVLSAAISNIDMLANKLHASFIYDEINKEYFVVYTDAVAALVAVENPDINDSIIEYKKIDNRGDLTRKAEVLCTLYKTLESYSDLFKGTTYNNLYSDTKKLFNVSGVRHNVDKDAIACATFNKMNPEELEEWYDKIFNMFLSCMVIKTYLEDKPDIDAIKK